MSRGATIPFPSAPGFGREDSGMKGHRLVWVAFGMVLGWFLARWWQERSVRKALRSPAVAKAREMVLVIEDQGRLRPEEVEAFWREVGVR